MINLTINEYLLESKLTEFIYEYSAGDTVEFDTGINKYTNYLKNIVSNLSLDKAIQVLNKLINKVLKIVKNVPLKVKIIGALISIMLMSYNITADDLKPKLNTNNEIIQNALATLATSIKNVTFKAKLKPFNNFLTKIAERESSNNWKAVNKYGYMGKYQFGKIALKDVGHKVDVEEFKKDPSVFPESKQDELMKKLLKNNIHYLRDYMDYVGKTIGGIDISLSGMLAGAHLVGHSAVKNFLKSDGKKDIEDANGTKCSEYMTKFGGYAIDLNRTYTIQPGDNLYQIAKKYPEKSAKDIQDANNFSDKDIVDLQVGQVINID